MKLSIECIKNDEGIKFIRRASRRGLSAVAQRCAPCQWLVHSVVVELGLESFATRSTSETIADPRPYRTAERRLKAAQRRVSRLRGQGTSAGARIASCSLGATRAWRG